jgi:hypothetical protein
MVRPRLFSAISLLLLSLPEGLADQILKTSGFSTCLSGSNITVQNLDIQYNADTMQVTFNVAGTSEYNPNIYVSLLTAIPGATSQNVTAQLNVTAYGTSVYQNSFNPCRHGFSPLNFVSTY